MSQILVTKELILPLISYNYNIEVDNQTQDLIADAITDYINGFFQEFLPTNHYQYASLGLEEWPETTSWEAAFPARSKDIFDNEVFTITNRNTAVVFEMRNHRIYITRYSGYVIENDEEKAPNIGSLI